jgi:hypothetical protein
MWQEFLIGDPSSIVNANTDTCAWKAAADETSFAGSCCLCDGLVSLRNGGNPKGLLRGSAPCVLGRNAHLVSADSLFLPAPNG